MNLDMVLEISKNITCMNKIKIMVTPDGEIFVSEEENGCRFNDQERHTAFVVNSCQGKIV